MREIFLEERREAEIFWGVQQVMGRDCVGEREAPLRLCARDCARESSKLFLRFYGTFKSSMKCDSQICEAQLELMI